MQMLQSDWLSYSYTIQSRSQSLHSPWPAVGKRELWEQPFQACAVDADCAVKLDRQNHHNSVISKWLLPELSFSNHRSRGTKTLRTRLYTIYQPLEYSGCRPSTKCEVFIVFLKFWRNVLMQMDNLIPEKTKRRTFMVSWLKNLKSLQKWVRVGKQLKISNHDNSVHAILLVSSLINVEK